MSSIEPARASEVIGRTVYRPTVTAVVVTGGLWGRLLGYERATAHGPWLLETLARLVIRRNSHEVAWDNVLWEPPARSS
jgi:hypothetical protein